MIVNNDDTFSKLEDDTPNSSRSVYRKIRTHLDLLSIPQSGGENVKTFRWDHRLQI